MKTASKVFIIISIVYSVIAFIGGIALAGIFPYGAIMIVWALISLTISCFALEMLSKARSHNELVTTGVLTMIFCSFLGGLFMLLIKDEELKQTMGRKVIPQSYSVRNFETFEEADDETDISDDEEDEYTSKRIENNTTPYVGNVTRSYFPANKEEVIITYCVYCEEELYDDDLFCGKCGKPTRNICPECDNVNNPQDAYCRNCGHKLK